MNSRRKPIYSAVAALMLLCVPAFAVFNEKSISQTLAVLRYELRQEYVTMSSTRDRLKKSQVNQHRNMVTLQKTCNELSLMLYSQSQDFTFDMTYALKTVTKEYEDFNKSKMPFDDIIERLDIEIGRYSRLVEALRRLPPSLADIENLPDSLKYHNDSVNFDRPLMADLRVVAGFKGAGKGPADSLRRPLFPADDEELKNFMLDDKGLVDRDSCILYATSLLKMYSATKDRIVRDNEHYEEANLRLKESYDYARDRYKSIQKKIFVEGQDSYFTILKSFGVQLRRAMLDARTKYARVMSDEGQEVFEKSEWSGPIVFGFIGIVLVWLFIASALSVVVIRILKRRVHKMQTDEFKQHIPCLTWLCGTIIFSISMFVIGNFVSQNFVSLAARHLLVFAWLLAAILLSLLIRLKGSQIRSGMMMYTPIIILGLVVIGCRIIFIPNRLINITLPPVLVLFCIWQIHVCRRNRKSVEDSDALLGWLTVAILVVATVTAWIGYVLLGIEVLMWWLFQMAAIETIVAIHELLEKYEEKKLSKKLPYGARKGENFKVTWFFDLVNDCFIPIIAILSIPLCIFMAADVFDLTEICKDYFMKSIVDLKSAAGQEILKLSLYNLTVIAVLFFIFKYFAYFFRSTYYDYKIGKETRRNGGRHIHTNEINFTLSNNVIGFAVWGIYIVTIFLILKIPTGALSIVFAGLATGLGLAMKDILNNFIYGIQLMSGRLRVGDYVECDGIRGKVSAISYQSTQIETIEGAVISYLNTSLFDKNFKNLTKSSAYEFVKIVVGVSYGTDVEKVREVLLEAMKKVQTTDKFGRSLVNMGKGVSVVVDDLSDSSVDIAVKQYVLVSDRAAFIAQAKEVIYNALNEAGITIPFPQCDVYIKESPQD